MRSPPPLFFDFLSVKSCYWSGIELNCEESTEIEFETCVQSLQSDTVFLLGIYRCLEFSIKVIYYLQNPCFNRFAPTDSSGTKELNSLQTHLRCVKVPDVLSLMYPSLHEGGGGFGPPHEQFALMDNRRRHFLRLVVLGLNTYGGQQSNMSHGCQPISVPLLD